MLEKKFKIYLYFCALTFFFLLGIVLFYSFGYKYDIQTKKTVQTGAIIIKTYPEELDIYKNDALFKNSKTIANLFSDFVKIEDVNNGTYNIKMKKEGYFSWEKNIDVKSGYVTELKNVILLKKDYSQNIILNKIKNNSGQNNIWTNGQRDKIAYEKLIGNEMFLAVYDFNKNSESIIANLKETLFGNIQEDYIFDSILFSDNNENIIAKIKTADKTFWYFIDTKNENKIYNLSQILEEAMEIKNGWNFSFGESMLFIKNGTLYKFDFTKKSQEKISNDIRSFSIYENFIYFFKLNDNKLYFGNIDNLIEAKSIIEMPKSFEPELLAKITKTNKKTYLILSSSGKLYFINEKNEAFFINSFAAKADFFNNDERIIYSNNHEIWIYYIKEKTSQPQKKELSNELITRFSGNISNVFLYKDEEHLFYKERDVLKFLEIDNRDKRNVFELFENDIDEVFYFKNSDLLYFIQNDELIQIDLNEK